MLTELFIQMKRNTSISGNLNFVNSIKKTKLKELWK